MTGRLPGREKAASEATGNDSSVRANLAVVGAALARAGPLGVLVLALGIAAAALLVAAELSTYRTIEVVTASCEELTRSSPDVAEDCTVTGGEQHSYALLLIAALVVLMAYGAGPGASGPAAGALAVAGLVTLGIALLGDLPHTDVTGAVGRNFDQAEGVRGPAITLEIVAAVIAIGAGALRLVADRRSP